MRLRFALSFAAALVLSACASFPPAGGGASKIPVTQTGKMSRVTLALVKRQNFILDGERTYSHSDGLVFYFVIEPAGETGAYPTIRESQNFTINGEPYWKNQAGSVDSYTVIYNSRTFAQNDPEASGKIAVANSDALIQKTIICGEPLPAAGLVRYLFSFGFEHELEEFEFMFALQDVL